MKNNNLLMPVAAALLAFTLLFAGCKKEEVKSTEQNLSLHMHMKVGANAAAYATEYTNASGRKFNLSNLRFYLSNFVLVKNDGSQLPLTNKVVLASPAVHDYDLGKVPVGDYKGFKFMVGLDSITNHKDPTVYSADNPLAIQSPAIHWSWNSGYIFMMIEGLVDSTAASTGSPDYEFFYHIGMDALSRSIDYSTSAFSVVSGTDKEIAMEFDLLQALTNVDMRTQNATHTMDNMPLAMMIADNWEGAFSLE